MLLMLFSATLFGQDARTITGKVTDSGGAGLAWNKRNCSGDFDRSSG